MTINAYEFQNASEALQHVDASDRGVAITHRGKPLVVSQAVRGLQGAAADRGRAGVGVGACERERACPDLRETAADSAVRAVLDHTGKGRAQVVGADR